MASMTSASVTLPSFTGLKVTPRASSTTTKFSTTTSLPKFSINASMKDVLGAAAVATAASAMLAGNAMALEVLLGGSDGSLAFVPSSATVSAGEKIIFKNNAGFPHNVIFDEDAVPTGVDAAKISMSEEDLLNAPGETYSVTLTEKGDYTVYCSPHQGAGMVGKITVN